MVAVYALKCLANEFAYVGCTKGKLAKRMREHRCLLNKGQHSAPLLQQDWLSHDGKGFLIVVLEQLPDDADVAAKRRAELSWMAHFKEAGKLYNENCTSFSFTPEAQRMGSASSHLEPGNRWTPEANLKRRLAQLGKPKGHGAKISATKRAKRS